MTRQHFRAQASLCADIIRDLDKSLTLTLGHIDDIIESFCDMCEDGNPTFDRKRFINWVTIHLSIREVDISNNG